MITASKPAPLRYSVVVPVYNEHEIIAQFCAKAVAELPPNFELLICYDMEEDSTLPAIRALAPTQKPANIRFVRNDLGKGVRYAIDAGMRAAKAPVVVVMMADVSDDFSKVDEMVTRAENGADVVCASRYMKGGKQVGGPKLKGFLSRMAGLTLCWFTGLPTHDPTNSFKAYRKDFLARTPIESTAGFSLGIELTAKAHFNGGKVEEVPATWLDRTAGKSRFQLGKWLPLYLRWYFWAFQRRLIGATPLDFVYTGIHLLLFLFALTMFIPWRVSESVDFFPATELDSSWYMVLPWAWRHGLDFGHDLIFTYGPWGFALQGYDPATFGYVVALWTLFTALFFIVAARIANSLSPRRWVGTIWLLLVLCIAGTSVQGMHDTRAFIMSWALVVLHFYHDDRPITPTKLLLTFAMALASLGKFSMGVTAFIAITIVSLDTIFRRRIPWLMATYLVSMFLLWLAAGQRIGSIWPYFWHSLEIASGYGQGVGQAAETELRDVTFYWLVGILLLFLVTLAYLPQIIRARRRDAETIHPDGTVSRGYQIASIRTAILPIVALAGALIMNFKAGFVRHDGHAMLVTTCLALLSLMYAASLWPKLNSLAFRVIAVVLVLAGISQAWYSQKRWVDRSLPTYFVEELTTLPSRAGRAVGWIFGSPTMNQIYQANLASYRELRPVPLVSGSVDMYSFVQRVVLANNLDYRPRPVFQSYLAYNPDLAGLNRDFLLSSRAPDSIFFDLSPIDNHYPSMEDGLSWPVILSHYALTDANSSVLHFRKLAVPQDYSLNQVDEIAAKFEQWLLVPQPRPLQGATQPVTPPAEMIWATVEVHQKLPGSLLQIGYKPPPVYMDVLTSNGATTRYRIVPDSAPAGFLLSPYVGDRMGMGALNSIRWRDCFRDSLVTQVMFNGGQDASFYASYAPEVKVRFFQLRLPMRDLSHLPGMEDYVQFRDILGQVQFLKAGGKPQIMNAENGMSAFVVPGNTQMLLPPRPQARTLRVAFGMLWQGFGPVEKVDPVDFMIMAVTPNDKDPNQATTQLIAHMVLDPANNLQDRSLRVLEVPLPDPRPVRLMLETMPRSENLPSYPYWQRIELR